jgi:hypothetical protein
MLEEFQMHQQILFDLTANYLEPLTSAYERLAYLCSLRRPDSGKYLHERLAALYGAESVDQVVAHCHEEVFERLLEMPLNAQGEDLRNYLSALPGPFEKNAAVCQNNYMSWIPPSAPSYLKELYSSNLDVLLELLRDDTSTGRPHN